MELLFWLVSGIVLVVGAIIMICGVSFLVGFAIALWIYGPYYHNNSSKTGKHASSWIREHSFWQILKRFYEYRIVQVGEAVTGKQGVLYACHPHGICALSVGFTFACRDTITKRFVPHTKVFIGALGLIFNIPILRDAYLALGCVNVDWQTLQSHIEAGHGTVLIPGGVNEMGKAIRETRDERFLERAYTAHTVGLTTIDIISRKTTTPPMKSFKPFVPRIITISSSQHSAPITFDIVPVYCHHEDDIYITWKSEWRWVTRCRLKCARWSGFPFPTFFIGPWPWEPLTTYIGPPHRYIRGETLESYKMRYWASLDSLKLEASKKEHDD